MNLTSKHIAVKYHWFRQHIGIAGLWGNEDPQDPICARSRTGFMVTFDNCPLLWVSKLQTEIDLSTLHSEYVALSQSVRALLPFLSKK